MKPKFLGLLVVAIMMAISLFAEAKIIRIPADYPTIQAGIDAARTDDIVLVADGTYTGDGNKNLDFKGKAITVRSKNGPESTIIDCEGSGSGFYFHSHENIGAVVKGFTIKNGDSSGIYCDNNSSPLIEGNIITNNSASQYGGGISCFNNSFPTIQDNEITYNSASQYGGGISCSNNSSPTIQNNEIAYNLANSYGGGIGCYYYSSPTIQNNKITYNSASPYGGGIGCHFSSPTIRNNEITYNSANSYGGGIGCDDSSPTIQKNNITGNAAFNGGGVACASSSPNITNNAITRNEANNGGGIYISSGTPSIINITFSRNLAQYGGGIYCNPGSSASVLNTILYFDSAYVSGNEIYLDPGGSMTVTYSDIAGGWEGEGNIDENPLFEGFIDYHLRPGSPCIDAGTPDGAPPDDIEGNPRDEKPDMGAYEFQGDKLGAINGTVTDKVTGTPIAKALVIAVQKSTKENDLTDDNGYYVITDLQPGDWWVIVIKEGYKAGIAKVVVEAGKTTTRDFALVPK